MPDLSEFKKSLEDRPVAVFGLGLSGMSVVRFLLKEGISVTAWDDKEENKKSAEDLGAKIEDLTSIDLSAYALLLLAPGVPYSFEPHPVVVNAQKYDLEIIGDLELLHRCNHGIKTVGITGTNGKSTTTSLMVHVLNNASFKAVMGGNIGKPVFDLDFSKDYDFLVLEISSYQMDLCPTFRPDVSIFLNITPDHLDRHGSMQAYIDAKAHILEGEGVAVISVDDDFTQVLFDKAFMEGKRKVIPVSVKSTIIEGYFVSSDKFFCNKHGEDIEIGFFDDNKFETLRGLHNHQNMACVFAAAREMGVASEQIFKAFESYEGLPHRQYLAGKKDKVVYINDSKATNAEAAAKGLSSYDNIFWIVGGRPKKGGLEGLEIFKDKIKNTYVIGEASEAFSAWLLYYGFAHSLCKTLDVATAKAHEDAQNSGEEATVLLSPACASWDQFPSFEVRGNEFTKKVTELIEKTG